MTFGRRFFGRDFQADFGYLAIFGRKRRED